MTHLESVMRLGAHFKTKLEDAFALADADFAKNQVPADQFQFACELYKRDSKNQFYPKNIQCVIDLVKKPITDDDVAQNIVSKILEYQIKKGTDWKNGVKASDNQLYFAGIDQNQNECLYHTFDEAMASVFGTVGLEIIKRENGWTNFCKNSSQFDKTILRPQLVRLAVSLLKHLEKTGSFMPAPLLSASNEPVLGQVKNLLNFKAKEMP
jgi:hypothetical protein